MTQMSSDRPINVNYLGVVWEHVVKMFLIDLLGAGLVLGATFILAIFLFVAGHIVWRLRFHAVAESFLYLAVIYLAVLFVMALKRHFSLRGIVRPDPEMPDSEATPVVDAGISTSISGS